FLRRTESDYLYLVGDIIDGWQLRRRWYWQQSHNDVVQKILRKARKGTEVIYIPGNHDEAVRHFLDLAFGDILIRDEAVHHTALGLRLLVIHGDWVESLTALVETIDGELKILYWHDFPDNATPQSPNEDNIDAHPDHHRRLVTAS